MMMHTSPLVLTPMLVERFPRTRRESLISPLVDDNAQHDGRSGTEGEPGVSSGDVEELTR